MLQARLELAPRVNPDWILSPTRLPIPPLERILSFQYSSCLPPLSQTILNRLLGRVPLERILSFQYSSCLPPLSQMILNHLLGRVPLERILDYCFTPSSRSFYFAIAKWSFTISVLLRVPLCFTLHKIRYSIFNSSMILQT